MNRIGTRVELTAQGQAYAADVRRALSMISGSANRNAARGVAGTLTVSCPPGFAASWLCAKVGTFAAAFPDVALSVLTPRRLDDVSNPDVDVFIAFSFGNHDEMEVELLKEVEFTPLCSPALLNRLDGLPEPGALAQATLLHLGDFEDWENWFRLAGLPVSDSHRGISFADMNLVYAAILTGQGVAMGDEFICHDALETGTLVRPFDLAIRSPRSYFLAVPRERTANPAVAAFKGWLMAELPES